MNIAICCSSSNNIPETYFESAGKLFENLFRRKNNLVFGAMNSGIMGLAYSKAKKYERRVIGILPKIYKSDLKDLECDEEILTKCVNDRTNLMVERADCIIVLPGGMATLYELFALIEMKRCHDFDKPIIIYNETGFFDGVFYFLDEKIFAEKFTGKAVLHNKFFVANNSNEVIDYLKNLNEKN